MCRWSRGSRQALGSLPEPPGGWGSVLSPLLTPHHCLFLAAGFQPGRCILLASRHGSGGRGLNVWQMPPGPGPSGLHVSAREAPCCWPGQAWRQHPRCLGEGGCVVCKGPPVQGSWGSAGCLCVHVRGLELGRWPLASKHGCSSVGLWRGHPTASLDRTPIRQVFQRG